MSRVYGCATAFMVVFSGCLCSALTLAQPQHEYAVFHVPGFGPDFTNAWGTNDSGVVVGMSFPDGRNVYHAYVWDGKQTIDLGTFGGLDSEAWDVNDAGTVIGWAHDPTGRRAFRWTVEDGLVDLGDFGGLASVAYGTNERGQIVGFAFNADQQPVAFVWEDGEMTPLYAPEGNGDSEARDLSEAGVVVGIAWSDTLQHSRATMWKDGVATDLGSLGDGTHRSAATAINELEQVVGESWDDDGENHAFVWIEGQMYKFTQGPIYYKSGLAWDINNNSEIVGSVYQGNTGYGFVWDQQRGVRRLEDMMPPGAYARVLAGTEITDSGIISAWGPLFDSKAFLFVPVRPELTLSDPVPGIVGQTNTWTIAGAQPNAKIHFAYSLKGGGTVVPGCDKLDAVVQLNKPKVVKTVTADANGEATVQLYVPPAASDVGLILFQAVDQQNCEESQLTTFDFE